MAQPNPLPLRKRSSSPIDPDMWVEVELTPEPLSDEVSAATMPSAEDVSNCDPKSFCRGFNAHYGPGEIPLPRLEEARRPMSSISSLPIALPQEPSHNALAESITIDKSKETGGAHGQCPEPFFSASVGRESSRSPSSSHPWTARCEIDGLSLSPSAPESLSYGCPFPPTDGFSPYSRLGQTGIDPEASPKSADETNRDNFSLLFVPPMPDKCARSSALSIPPFTTRCVQPTGLLGHPGAGAKPKKPAFELAHSAHGKASLSPENWKNQGVFCDENIECPPRPLRNGTMRKTRPRRRTFATEPLTKTKSNGTRRRRSALPPSHESDDTSGGSEDTPRTCSGAAEYKTPDGKFVCRRICTDTRVVCGKKFQKSERLHRHWSTHEYCKPYQFQICERCFGRIDNFMQHIKTH
ncbi:hypothetical protein PTTG_03150 [Puccinia triticina 1-1 BBBD Race 1]|uniref:C2H2-type domain-containing protein n=1 Tax=Puccinia triticina (isolate 1-1 / race 1 (BBBD)) TaxID=630390 RepID=A0A180GYJ7_PUCT1|nr:hypothetical protein PTTG_03150 [Puccinia triticina 1-1 BBBD Race 1]